MGIRELAAPFDGAQGDRDAKLVLSECEGTEPRKKFKRGNSNVGAYGIRPRVMGRQSRGDKICADDADSNL